MEPLHLSKQLTRQWWQWWYWRGPMHTAPTQANFLFIYFFYKNSNPASPCNKLFVRLYHVSLKHSRSNHAHSITAIKSELLD